MTITEAIKRLHQRAAWLAQFQHSDVQDIQLGIEALKWIEKGRSDYPIDPFNLLQGEERK